MAITKVTTGTIEDGTIVNADVNASAAIASTKLSGVDTGLSSVQTFTSSGTWTRPTGVTKVIMEIQGAGGAGSRSDSTDNKRHGGAGGGYAKKFLDVSSISTATITVGAGGAATSSNDTAGGDGGASSWADGTNTITGNGGAGGSASANIPSAGGTATGGDLNIQGGNSTSLDASAGAAADGAGDSMLGFRGEAHWSGSNPSSYGSSGYGAGTGPGVSANSLRAGHGIVIVWEYN